MKLSKISMEKLLFLSPEEKEGLVCGGICDGGESGEFALLLGSSPFRAEPRARAAAELYRQGRVKYIVPSGGVKWDTYGEQMTEAEYMRRILLSEGVPEDAIVMENEATTTKENMIYGALQMNRKTHFYSGKKVIIVSSEAHMKRSLALAKAFLPRFVEISAYPSKTEGDGTEHQKLYDSEIKLLKGLVDNGMIEDIDVNEK